MTKPEQSWILLGMRLDRVWMGRRVREKSGDDVSVTVDHAWIIQRDADKHDIIGFYHTHPNCIATPSQRDIRTMRAWVGCLGKPLLCTIRGTDGTNAYVFHDDTGHGTPLKIAHDAAFRTFIGVEYAWHARIVIPGLGRYNQASPT